eukprot:1108001_1
MATCQEQCLFAFIIITICVHTAPCVLSHDNQKIDWILNNPSDATVYYLGIKTSSDECETSCLNLNYLCDKSHSDIVQSDGSFSFNTANCSITIYAADVHDSYIPITPPLVQSVYSIAVDVRVHGSGEAGLMWKSNMMYGDAYLGYSFGITDSKTITQFDNGLDYTVLDTKTPNIVSNVVYSIEVQVNDNNYATYFENQQCHSGSHRSEFTDNDAGIYSWHADATFSSFKITFANDDGPFCAGYVYDTIGNHCHGYYGTDYTTIEASLSSDDRYDSATLYKDTCPPTESHTKYTTQSPSKNPSLTESPTKQPSDAPSLVPSQLASIAPSSDPVIPPSQSPSLLPTNHPVIAPSHSPSQNPTLYPTNRPNVTVNTTHSITTPDRVPPLKTTNKDPTSNNVLYIVLSVIGLLGLVVCILGLAIVLVRSTDDKKDHGSGRTCTMNATKQEPEVAEDEYGNGNMKIQMSKQEPDLPESDASQSSEGMYDNEGGTGIAQTEPDKLEYDTKRPRFVKVTSLSQVSVNQDDDGVPTRRQCEDCGQKTEALFELDGHLYCKVCRESYDEDAEGLYEYHPPDTAYVTTSNPRSAMPQDGEQ